MDSPSQAFAGNMCDVIVRLRGTNNHCGAEASMDAFKFTHCYITKRAFLSSMIRISSKGTRAFSAIPFSLGVNSSMGVRAYHAAPLNHGTGLLLSPADDDISEGHDWRRDSAPRQVCLLS